MSLSRSASAHLTNAVSRGAWPSRCSSCRTRRKCPRRQRCAACGAPKVDPNSAAILEDRLRSAAVHAPVRHQSGSVTSAQSDHWGDDLAYGLHLGPTRQRRMERVRLEKPAAPLLPPPASLSSTSGPTRLNNSWSTCSRMERVPLGMTYWLTNALGLLSI